MTLKNEQREYQTKNGYAMGYKNNNRHIERKKI